TTFVASFFGSGEARRGSIPRSGAVTEEQRSQNRKATQPSGRRFSLAQTSLLTPYRPLKGMLGCPCGSTSRLVWAKNPSPQTWSYFWNGVLRHLKVRQAARGSGWRLPAFRWTVAHRAPSSATRQHAICHTGENVH